VQVETEEEYDEVISELDHFFLISVGTLVLLLQSGYAFLEAGAVRSKNAVNICLRFGGLLNTVYNSCIQYSPMVKDMSAQSPMVKFVFEKGFKKIQSQFL
jgi:ammonia channel protein AmtB